MAFRRPRLFTTRRVEGVPDGSKPFTVALHTSWSHRPEAPCFRLVLPLARPVPGPRWGEAWSLAVQALGLPVDRACSNANRRYLLPARPREEAPVVAEVRATDLALDLLPLLPAPADSSAVPRRRVVVPLHRVDRAVIRRMALDPAARRRLADSLGAVVRGSGRSERAEGIPCPGCGRASALAWSPSASIGRSRRGSARCCTSWAAPRSASAGRCGGCGCGSRRPWRRNNGPEVGTGWARAIPGVPPAF